MPETLKIHPTVEAPETKAPELTPDTKIEDLSTGEINVILEELEKDFQEPTTEKVERKKGSAQHEHNYDLSQSITSGIDYLIEHSKNGVVEFNGLTIKKRVGKNILANEYAESGETITDSRDYDVSHTLNLGSGIIHTDRANISVADAHVSVGFSSKEVSTGLSPLPKKPAKRGWGGAVWVSDAPLRYPKYENSIEDEIKTRQHLEWMNKQIAEQVEKTRVKQSRSVGQKLLHMWIGG